jgi:hypothetical protein
MDIGSNRQKVRFGLRPHLTQEERDRRVRDNLCIYCGEAGHRKDNCPKRGQPSGPSLHQYLDKTQYSRYPAFSSTDSERLEKKPFSADNQSQILSFKNRKFKERSIESSFVHDASSSEMNNNKKLIIYGQIQCGISELTVPFLLDCGADESILDMNFCKQFSIPLELLHQTIPIRLFDGTDSKEGIITHRTKPLRLDVNGHIEFISFFVSRSIHEGVLGYSWLRKHNPEIDWTSKKTTFKSEFCLSNCTAKVTSTQSPFPELDTSPKTAKLRLEMEEISFKELPREIKRSDSTKCGFRIIKKKEQETIEANSQAMSPHEQLYPIISPLEEEKNKPSNECNFRRQVRKCSLNTTTDAMSRRSDYKLESPDSETIKFKALLKPEIIIEAASLRKQTFKQWLIEQSKPSIKDTKLRTIHQELKEETNRDDKYFADRKRTNKQFEVNDLVYLSTKNLSTNRPSKKLDFKRIGPFKIIEKISATAFKLELPSHYKTHNVFHISLLSQYEPVSLQDAPIPPTPEVIDHSLEYTVRGILDSKTIRRKLHYLVAWHGYSDHQATWEPANNLTNCKEAITDFYLLNPSKRGEAGEQSLHIEELRLGYPGRKEQSINQSLASAFAFVHSSALSVFNQKLNEHNWLGPYIVYGPMKFPEGKKWQIFAPFIEVPVFCHNEQLRFISGFEEAAETENQPSAATPTNSSASKMKTTKQDRTTETNVPAQRAIEMGSVALAIPPERFYIHTTPSMSTTTSANQHLHSPRNTYGSTEQAKITSPVSEHSTSSPPASIRIVFPKKSRSAWMDDPNNPIGAFIPPHNPNLYFLEHQSIYDDLRENEKMKYPSSTKSLSNMKNHNPRPKLKKSNCSYEILKTTFLQKYDSEEEAVISLREKLLKGGSVRNTPVIPDT